MSVRSGVWGAVSAMFAGALGDVTVGVLVLASAVGVSAALTGRPLQPMGAVAARVWAAYALVLVLMVVGMLVVIPGLVTAVGVALVIDPNAAGERSGPWLRLPPPAALPALLGLLVVVATGYFAWQCGASMYVATAPLTARAARSASPADLRDL